MWFGVYPLLFATGLTIAGAVSNSGLWGWVVVYDVGVSLLVVSLVLDGYSFEQDGLRIYSLARLRVRRIEWQQIRNFDVRGYWRGAGVWLVDGRWVGLRPGSWPYREKSESEVSRLEIARQMHQGTSI